MVVRQYLLLVTFCLICALTVHIIISYNQVSLVGEPSSIADKRHNYKSLYFQVVDSSMSMLSDGLADRKNFAFLDLVNPFMFKQLRKGMPPDTLQLLKCKYGPLFHTQTLENQLVFCLQ